MQKIYHITQRSLDCTVHNCFERCINPSCQNLCCHMYHCSCPDYSLLCKHIHKVHSMFVRNVPVQTVDLNESIAEVVALNVQDKETSTITVDETSILLESCRKNIAIIKASLDSTAVQAQYLPEIESTLKDI